MPATSRTGRTGRTGRLRPVDSLIGAHGLSSFCLGLAMPYTAIYLADRPEVGTAGVAVFYGTSGIANLVVALLLSTGAVKLARIPLGVLGTLLWLLGYLGVSAISSYPVLVASGIGVGAGQGCFMAALIPLINALITPEERRKVFARRYAVLNATLACGSLVSGLLVLALPRTVIPYFFMANALGILPLMIAMLAVRRHVPPPVQPEEGDEEAAPLPVFALWKVMMPVALFQLAASLFAFSQFDATAPLVTTDLMDMPLFTVSLMLFVNVTVIVAFQRPMTRRLESRTELTGLRVAVGLWVVAYVVAGLFALAPFGFRMAGLLLYVVLFGLGECAYSCSFHPWLISMVPDRELTRANALVNSMMGVGKFAGPSIGVGLALTGSGTVVWLGLAAGCTLVTVLAGLLTARRQQTAAPTAAKQLR
ncbi:MFS transporter [Streptomyces sp. NBC_00237]|uniref:MFS transporter n=1 Tax=Streptomyces sp. NBC_00237 TaxID=2975687 RepID=UPI0022507130|nr:MFS transporter [Streptomyces sp. NBC_00237]MCX5206816.1 MFS transporter [Streptomyces sp. NBC_00237]